MLCHGELVRLKPPPRQLTRFYLMVSAGGALGGVFVALIGPQVFSTLVEIHIAIVAVFMLAMGVFWDAMWGAWLLRKIWRRCLVFLAGFGLLIVVVRAQFVSLAPSDSVILTRRNFYGVLSVKEKFRDDSEYHIRELMNGSTLHGSQFQNALKSRLPTTYYNAESGIGLAMVRNRNPPARRIGVVGLGTGTLAVFGRPGQSFFFYEINPLVPRIAREQFSYITDTAAKVEILPGDARLTMERQTPQEYDLIALDAFSSDAIPAHLLTKEAFEQYFRHLRKATGIIAVHVSNRHLDLTPVVGGIAEHFKIPVIKISAEDHDGIGDAGSDWMLITHNQAFLDDELIRAAATEVNGPYRTVKGKTHAIPLWTDQYSNLFQILE
jgi:hypothetical protein